MVQATHAPAPLHTSFVPHEVPAAIGVVVSTHVCCPVAQEYVPCTHGFGFVLHVAPAVHATHAPP